MARWCGRCSTCMRLSSNCLTDTSLHGICVICHAGGGMQVIPVVGARPFILFGASMCAAPSTAPGPTATAVVASRDRSLGRYSCRLGLQPASRTSIENMQVGPLGGRRRKGRVCAVQGMCLWLHRLAACSTVQGCGCFCK